MVDRRHIDFVQHFVPVLQPANVERDRNADEERSADDSPALDGKPELGTSDLPEPQLDCQFRSGQPNPDEFHLHRHLRGLYLALHHHHWERPVEANS